MSAAAHHHEDPVQLVLSKLPKAKKSGDSWSSPCPAHDDKNPSMSVSRGRDGGCVVHCHVGCTVEAIVDAIGLTLADLMPPKQQKASAGKLEIECTYDYHDEKGNVRFQVVRLKNPKDFRQRHMVAGEWIWKMKGVERVLYHLPEVLEAKQAKRVIFLVEGEKDADNLRAIGFAATTNPGGAKKWLNQYTDTLAGADVIIWPDNDKTGSEHRDLVCEKLHGFVASLRIMESPDPHKDASDWILRGGATAADIKARAKEARLYVAPAIELASAEPPSDEGEPAAAPKDKPRKFALTDIGNAERLVARHGDDFHYVPEWKSWLVWDGRRWQRDKTHELERRAKDTIRNITSETKTTLMNAEQREKLVNFSKKSESNSSVNNMLSRARAEPGIAIATDQLDAHPWLLNLKNGTLDLRTAELKPHDRAHLMTKFVPIEYDQDATCPTWLAFLARVMRDNATLIEYLQMSVGYALTGSTAEQCFFLLHGIGANGKTTFIETIQVLAGDYGTSTDFRTFIESKNDRGPRDDVAELFGARVVTAVEVGEGKRFNESLVKSLTGSDTVRARFLYESAFQFKPQFKLFLAANHKPVIRGTDEGIWRRVRLIPFTVQIPKEEQDKELLSKLRDELPGILAWAIDGCQLWLERGGLGLPDEVRAAGDDYRSESDTLGAFIDEYCELGREFSEPSKLLYDAYAQWAKEGGEFQLSQTAFGRRLEERGIIAEKRGSMANRKVWRLGIRLVVRPSGNAQRPKDSSGSTAGGDQDPMLFS